MPEPVFYMRGFPRGFPDQVTGNEQLVHDLSLLADIPAEKRSQIRDELSNQVGFLSPKAIRTIVEGITGDTEVASALGRIVRSFSPDDLDQFFKSLSKEREQDPEKFPFSAEQLEKVKSSLSELVQTYPAVVRHMKADNLAKATGDQLESVELICDIRPIFDENREQIEGMMPYSRMRVVVTGIDGLPKAMNAELSVRQVHQLLEKVQKAKKKLEVIHEYIATTYPEGSPDLQLTRRPDEDTTDV